MSSSGESSTETPTPLIAHNRLLLYLPTAWDGSNNKGTQKQQKIPCECFYGDSSTGEQSLPVALYPYQESVISTLPLSLRLEILVARTPLLLKHESKLPMDLFTKNSAILLSTANTQTTDKTPKFVLLLPMSFNCSLLYPITKTTLLHNLQQISLQSIVLKDKKYSRKRFLPAVSSATAPSQQQDWKSLLLDEDCIKTNQPDCISSEVDQKPAKSSLTAGPTENAVEVVQQQPTETTEALPILDHYYNNCIFHEDILLLPTSTVADTITHFATVLLPNKIRAVVASKDTTSGSGSSAEYWFQNCDFIQEMYIPHRILNTCFQTKELPQSIKLRIQRENVDVRFILCRVLAIQIMIRLQITSTFELFHKDDYFMKDFTNSTEEKAKKQLKKKRKLDTSTTNSSNSQQQQISGAIIKLLSHAPFLLPPDITFTDFLAWTVGLPYLSSNISWIVSDIYAQFELDPPLSKEPQTKEHKKKKARASPKKLRDPKNESKQQSRASVSTVTSTAAVTSNKFLKGSKASYGQKVGNHFTSKLLNMHHHPLLLGFDGNTSASRVKCNKNMNTRGSNKENKLSSQWQPMHTEIEVAKMNGREIWMAGTPQKNEWMVEETPMKTTGRLASSFVADAAAAARRESRSGN